MKTNKTWRFSSEYKRILTDLEVLDVKIEINDGCRSKLKATNLANSRSKIRVKRHFRMGTRKSFVFGDGLSKISF